MRRNKPSARLPPHLLDRLKRLAEQEKMSVNQLVTLAVAEKPARLDAEAFYRAREGRSAPGAGWAGAHGAGRSAGGRGHRPTEHDRLIAPGLRISALA